MGDTMAVPSRTSAAQIGARRVAKPDRLFYVIAASMMLIFTAEGFRNFYLHGRAPWGNMTAQIMPLIVAHGLAMSSWVILFLVQSVLIRTGRRKLHLVIGLGGVLAAAIVILGATVAPLSVHFSPQVYTTIGGARPFLAMMWVQMLSFGTLVGIGLLYRRRPEIHRPMMLLATIVIQTGALGRCPYIEHIAALAPLYVWGPVLLLGGLLFLLQWGMSRTANRWYLMGYAGMVIASFVSVAIGTSAMWNRMVSAIVP